MEENRHVVSVFVSCKMLIQCWLIQLGNHGKSYRLSFAQCQISLSWTPRSSLEAMFQEALVDANHSLSLDQSKENIKAGQRGCQNTVRIQKYPEPLHSWYKPFQTFLWPFFPKASPMLGFSFSLLRRGGSKTDASTSWTDSRPWEMAWGKLRGEGARWKRGRTGNIRKLWEIGWGGLTDRKPWEIAWGELVGRVRDGSVDGQETLGERASLGGGRRKRSEAWTDGQLGASSVGRGRNGSMDGQETVGNSLGKNSIILHWEGAMLWMQSCWQGFYRTNSTNAIVPKNCVPKTCQMVSESLGGGTRVGKTSWLEGCCHIARCSVRILSCDFSSEATKLNENPSIGDAWYGVAWCG